jgi:hypothetical protein
MPNTSSEMAAMENFLHFSDSVPMKIRAKRGCATHPRSIAERVCILFKVIIYFFCLKSMRETFIIWSSAKRLTDDCTFGQNSLKRFILILSLLNSIYIFFGLGNHKTIYIFFGLGNHKTIYIFTCCIVLLRHYFWSNYIYIKVHFI